MVYDPKHGCDRTEHEIEEFAKRYIIKGAKSMTSREEVYKAIDSEREYQKTQWNSYTTESGGLHSVAEFILYMEHYVYLARVEASTKPDPASREAALKVVRKIAGLAVNCMEQHGAPQRKGFER